MTDTFASLLPEDADKSAYLDGAEATIVSCRAATTDYDGKVTPAVPAIAVQFHVAALAADKQPRLQHYSVGNPEHRIPSEDGKRFKVFGNRKGIPQDSNGMKFITSILNAPHVSGKGGFPKEKITDDLTIFDGMKVKLRSEAQNKDKKVEGQKSDDKERTIVLVDQIVVLPWENSEPRPEVKPQAKKAAGTAAPVQTTTQAGTTAAPAASAPTAGGPMNDEGARKSALAAVVTMLADEKNAGAIDKAKLGPLSFRILSNDPNRLTATKLLTQQASEFLPTIVDELVTKGDDLLGTIGFDGSKVVLVKAA